MERGTSGTESSILRMKKQLQPGTAAPSFVSLGRNSIALLLGPQALPSLPLTVDPVRACCSALRTAEHRAPGTRLPGGGGREGSGLALSLPCGWTWKSSFQSLEDVGT